MSECFGSFAKATIRYLQGLRPVIGQQNRLAALRGIEQALTEKGGGADPARIDALVLNRAAQIVTEYCGKTSAYRIGGQIEHISDLLRDKRFAPSLGAWRNPLRRPSDTAKVGTKFEEERAQKMPSKAALDAVAIAFRIATDPRDVIAISATAIMCSAPDRIAEVLTMPEDCEVPLLRPGKVEAYGLRWWPAKGAEPMIKWIVPTMVTIAKEAVSKIRRHTKEARKIAAWYETHPDQIYLPEDFEYLRQVDVVSFEEARALLGYQNVRQWANNNDVIISTHCGKPALDFSSLERAVVAMLPDGFPVLDHSTGLKYSEALFVAMHNQFRIHGTPNRCMITPINQQRITDALGNRVEHGFASVFTRLNITASDGSPIQINSHQFRHWLNTLAQRGGMSQLDIAKWSGRKDVRQNRAYDHMSGVEVLQRVRESVANDDQLFGAVVAFRPNTPLSRDEFARMLVPTAHQTDLGFCVHDYAVMPCQLHRDCVNCPEQVCIKGDTVKTERLRQRLTTDRELLAKAERAGAAGTRGADRWIEHHRTTVARLEQLLGLMEDTSIPDGTVLRLAAAPNHTFLLERGYPPSSLQQMRQTADGAAALEDLRSVMGGME
jgi:hypothetical protein